MSDDKNISNKWMNQMRETQQMIENAMNITEIASLNRVKESQIIIERINEISGIIAFEEINKTKRMMENAVNIPEMKNFNQIRKAIDSIVSFRPDILEVFADTNLESVSFTESDEKNVEKIIQSDDVESLLQKEMYDSEEKITQPTNSILLIIIMFIFISLAMSQLNTSVEKINDQTIFNINVEFNISSEDIKTKSKKDNNYDYVNLIIKEIIEKVKFIGDIKYVGMIIGIILDKVKVYSKKTSDSVVIGELEAPIAVKIIKTDGEWSYIIYEDPSGKKKLEGWILSSYIKKIGDFDVK